MDTDSAPSSSDISTNLPTREALNAELVDVPRPPEPPASLEAPGLDHVLAVALRHVRGKRGGDLVAVILVGSGSRRALTPHSDVDLIALVKGEVDRREVVRVADRVIDIRYRGHHTVEEEVGYSPRLPPLLRKGRILFEHEGIGSKVIEKAQQRFRQGPPPASLNEQIRLKADCLHWLGKAEDVAATPATALYLLTIFFEDFVTAFFRLRGLWLTAPVDVVRFLTSRDPVIGDLASRFLIAPTLSERLTLGRQLANHLFKDIPNPARID